MIKAYVKALKYAEMQVPEKPHPLARKDLKERWSEFANDPDLQFRVWNHPLGDPSGGYNTIGRLSKVNNPHYQTLLKSGLLSGPNPPALMKTLETARAAGSSDVTLTPELLNQVTKETRRKIDPAITGMRLRFDTGKDHVGRTNAISHVFPATPTEPPKPPEVQ